MSAMEKRDVIAYFDGLAATWDERMQNRDAVISRILDNAGVGAGQDVLDVACGTGVLFPDYLSRGAGSVTGIDISPEMARIAAAKFAGRPTVTVVCGDAEEAAFGREFDRIVVYNAFPHFPDGARLIGRLCDSLKRGGRLSVAHGFSREAINARHGGAAGRISRGLMPVGELAALFAPRFDVDIAISDDDMYQVAGAKR